MSESPSQTKLSETRCQFVKEVLNLDRTEREIYAWKTRQWIHNKIRDMQENEPCQKFIVTGTCDNKVLRITNSYRYLNFQIVPVEDYFDVIYAAHILTGHGARHKMVEYFRNRELYVPIRALTIFLGFCMPCQASRVENFRMYHAFLELIDMSDTPDGKMKFVMHYKALELNHVFLRALSSSNAVEIAEHLVDLFRQIGAPSVLRTPNISFTEALILRLAIVFPDCKIVSGREMVCKEQTEGIKYNIAKWMTYKNTTEWSKIIHYDSITKFKYRRKQTEEPFQNVFDVQLPGPSFTPQRHTLLQKQAHEAYVQQSITPDEVLKLLKPIKTYSKTTSVKSTQVTNILQNLYKTYTVNKKEKLPTTTTSLYNDKEGTTGKRALCVDSKLKDVVLIPSKSMKKNHEVWNSTLDLPEQNVSRKKTSINIEFVDNLNFGAISNTIHYPTSNDLQDDIICSKETINLPFDPFTNTSKILENDVNQKIMPTTVIDIKEEKPDIEDTLTSDDFTEEKPCFETPVDYYTLKSEVKEESPFETPIIFHSPKNDSVKEEPLSFETMFDSQKNNEIKQEEQYFGMINKVESLAE